VSSSAEEVGPISYFGAAAPLSFGTIAGKGS
jgi:hypothetical protein